MMRPSAPAEPPLAERSSAGLEPAAPPPPGAASAPPAPLGRPRWGRPLLLIWVGLLIGLLIASVVTGGAIWGVALMLLAAWGLGRWTAPDRQAPEIQQLRTHNAMLREQLKSAPRPLAALPSLGDEPARRPAVSALGHSEPADAPVPRAGHEARTHWSERLQLQQDVAHWRLLWAQLAEPAITPRWAPATGDVHRQIHDIRQQRQQLLVRGVFRPLGTAGDPARTPPLRGAEKPPVLTAAQHTMARALQTAFDSATSQWLSHVLPDTLDAAETHFWTLVRHLDEAAQLVGLELDRDYVALRLQEARLVAQAEPPSWPVEETPAPSRTLDLLTPPPPTARPMGVILQCPLLAEEVYWVGVRATPEVERDEVWVRGWPLPWIVCWRTALEHPEPMARWQGLLQQLRPWALLDRGRATHGWIRGPWRDVLHEATLAGFEAPPAQTPRDVPMTRAVLARIGHRVLEAGSRTPGLEALMVWQQERARALGASEVRGRLIPVAPQARQPAASRPGPDPSASPMQTATARADPLEEGSCPDERWYRLVETFRIRQGVGL